MTFLEQKIYVNKNLQISDGKRLIFWKATEELRSLPQANLAQQFYILSDVLRKISFIGQKFEYMINSAVFSDCILLPSRCLVFTKFIIKNSYFSPFLSENELLLWSGFESFFCHVLYESNSPELPETFLDIQKSIEQSC